MIRGVGIVIPARDERQRVRRCLRGVATALRTVPAGIDTAVCVVADRCADDTADLARDVLGHGRVVVNRAERTIGEVRDLGCRHVLAALCRHPWETVVLLSTDADSVVAPDWVRQHVRLVDEGADAVAGTVELAGRRSLPPGVVLRYTALLDQTRGPAGHGNVYGANLAVRADAYQAVGGFGVVASGEDHDVWRRLGEAGYRRRFATGPTVLTSARRDGRAPGGLADLLRTLGADA